MKKTAVFLFCLMFEITLTAPCVYGGCVISCQARYIYEIYHEPTPPAYFYGPLGGVTFAGTGTDGYYEKKWSNWYTLNIEFYSGYELDEASGYNNFNDNSIIAIMNWRDGGHSVITLEKWYTQMKYITKEEVMYDNNSGQRISVLNGYDKKKYYWEIYPE